MTSLNDGSELNSPMSKRKTEAISDSDSNQDQNFEELSPTIQDGRIVLNEETVALYRDSEDNYQALERLFGTMT